LPAWDGAGGSGSSKGQTGFTQKTDQIHPKDRRAKETTKKNNKEVGIAGAGTALLDQVHQKEGMPRARPTAMVGS